VHTREQCQELADAHEGACGVLNPHMDHLTIKSLPDCLHVDFGVTAHRDDAEEREKLKSASGNEQSQWQYEGGDMGVYAYYTIGLEQGDELHFEYKPEPTLNNHVVKNMHCVYPTLKPRCLAFTKPTLAFTKSTATTCKSEVVQPGGAKSGGEIGCFEQCMSLFCSTDLHGKHQKHTDASRCGSQDRFDSCANCCDRLKEGEGFSGCVTGHNRRRRLSEVAEVADEAAAVEDSAEQYDSKNTVQAEKNAKMGKAAQQAEQARKADKQAEKQASMGMGLHHHGPFTQDGCATECLARPACIAYDYDPSAGTCVVAHHCDAQLEGSDSYEKGRWFVRTGLTKKDLGNIPKKKPGTKKYSKKRSQDGKPKKVKSTH